MAKLTASKKRANEKWLNKNRQKQKLYVYRSNAKTYINKFADLQELKELKHIIDDRIEEIMIENNSTPFSAEQEAELEQAIHDYHQHPEQAIKIDDIFKD